MFMCRFLCGHKFSAHLGKHKGLQLLDLTVRLFCLSGTAKLSSKVAITMSSCCSTFTPAFALSYFVDHDHSNRYDVMSHCGFNCFSLMTGNIEYFFMYLLAFCISSLETSLLRFFANF